MGIKIVWKKGKKGRGKGKKGKGKRKKGNKDGGKGNKGRMLNGFKM